MEGRGVREGGPERVSLALHSLWLERRVRRRARCAASRLSSQRSELTRPHVLRRPFTLLASTTLLLTVLVGGGIALLYAVGEDTLPGTLSAVSGMGGHAKRD